MESHRGLPSEPVEIPVPARRSVLPAAVPPSSTRDACVTCSSRFQSADLYPEDRKYFGLSEFIESTLSGHSLPLLRYDSSFEAMVTALGKRYRVYVPQLPGRQGEAGAARAFQEGSASRPPRDPVPLAKGPGFRLVLRLGPVVSLPL